MRREHNKITFHWIELQTQSTNQCHCQLKKYPTPTDFIQRWRKRSCSFIYNFILFPLHIMKPATGISFPLLFHFPICFSWFIWNAFKKTKIDTFFPFLLFYCLVECLSLKYLQQIGKSRCNCWNFLSFLLYVQKF